MSPKIKSERKRLRLTQETLAAKAGVDVRTVQRAETGESISLKTAELIAGALFIEPKDLGSGETIHEAHTSERLVNIEDEELAELYKKALPRVEFWKNENARITKFVADAERILESFGIGPIEDPDFFEFYDVDSSKNKTLRLEWGTLGNMAAFMVTEIEFSGDGEVESVDVNPLSMASMNIRLQLEEKVRELFKKIVKSLDLSIPIVSVCAQENTTLTAGRISSEIIY